MTKARARAEFADACLAMFEAKVTLEEAHEFLDEQFAIYEDDKEDIEEDDDDDDYIEDEDEDEEDDTLEIVPDDIKVEDLDNI